MIMEYVLIAIMAILVENVFFTRALDAGNVGGILASPKDLLYFGGTFTAMSTINSTIAYVINYFAESSPYRLYILPVAFTIVIGVVYILGYYIIQKCNQGLMEKIKNIIGDASVNCAMLGILFIGIRQSNNIFQIILYGFSSGIGFTLALAALVVARRRLVYSDVPKVFKGLPILMLYIGLLSLGIFGLLGHRLTA